MEDNEKHKIKDALDTHAKYTDAYIGILNAYKTQIENSIIKKNELKGKFFNVIKWMMLILLFLFMVSVIGSFIVFYNMINKDNQSIPIITGAITAMISSFTTIVISIFKLPKIVVNYLFNKKEDNQMNEIIKNIQTYEIDAVKLERIVSIAAEEEKVNEQTDDNHMESSPNLRGNHPENSSKKIVK